MPLGWGLSLEVGVSSVSWRLLVRHVHAPIRSAKGCGVPKLLICMIAQLNLQLPPLQLSLDVRD